MINKIITESYKLKESLKMVKT